jgi:hypothetical protein
MWESIRVSREFREQEVGKIHDGNLEMIGSIHPLGTRVGDPKRVGDRHFVSPGDKEDLHFGITKSDFLKERRAPLCGGQLTSYRGSGYRESCGQSVYAFQHCDVRNPDKEYDYGHIRGGRVTKGIAREAKVAREHIGISGIKDGLDAWVGNPYRR